MPWCDLVPELPKGRPVDAKTGYAPSRFGNLWFGKWYYWREKLRFAVDRVRRLTKGRAEVLLVTTCPALARWETMDELAAAARVVAAEKKTGLADVAAAFHAHGAGETERAALFAWDKTHLGEPGHRLAAETVFQALGQQPH